LTARRAIGSDRGHAGYYYPWLVTRDGVTGEQINIPASGHVAGVYARSDTTRGVHKAPANEQIRNVVGLAYTISFAENERLNPEGVNCLRAFPGRGTLVWGARTIAKNPSWTYVNVRRLFIYLEDSIERGTEWVVFEPNNEKLWARVRQTITNFLVGVWRANMLMGTTPEEAFFVRCDRTTMTQDDIDNGRLVCVIGVAPVKPAEFVIFRIAQWTAGSEVT
jgi:phage tail sheath protein FI